MGRSQRVTRRRDGDGVLGDGYTVRAAELAAGGKDVTGLLDTCEKIASDAVTAMTGMGEAASGHAGLASALLAAAEQGTKTFLGIGAAYQYTGTSLDASAGTYAQAENENTGKINAIGAGTR
jgi:hypothetical protein